MKKRNLLSVVIALTLIVLPLLLASNSAVNAAALTAVSDTMSDSGVSAESDHEIKFSATSGISSGQTITLKFDDALDRFDLTGLVVADVTMLAGTCGSESSITVAAAPSGATWGVNINDTTDVVTVTSGTGTVAAGNCVIIRIGTEWGGTHQIANPSSAGVYDIDVNTTSDTGVAKVSVLDHVVVDVTVDETLTFTVTGQTSGQCNTTAQINTTATSVSYGSVNANQFYQGCQELLVTTNASDGYSVTVQQDGPLTSAAVDTIAPGNGDGSSSVGTDSAWATASNNGFGYCVEDITGTDAQASAQCDAGAAAGYRLFGTLGTDTPEVIMSNASNVDTNVIEVGYKISISGIQPAGTYSNDVLYVATPIY